MFTGLLVLALALWWLLSRSGKAKEAPAIEIKAAGRKNAVDRGCRPSRLGPWPMSFQSRWSRTI